MKRTPKRRQPRALASILFLPAVPVQTLASFVELDLVLSEHTRPCRLKNGWAIRLVWRNRENGLSAVVTFRLSDDRVLDLIGTAYRWKTVVDARELHGLAEGAHG